MSYPEEFRRQVLSYQKKKSLTLKETAQHFEIGIATLWRWQKRIEIQVSRTRRRKIDKAALLRDVEQHPDAYQYERAQRFHVSQRAIGQALKKLGISYKKNAQSPQGQRAGTYELPK